MKPYLLRTSFLLSLAALIVVLDQWTKLLVVNSLMLEERIELIPHFFDLTYVRNYGAAFGIFSRFSPSIRQMVLLGLPSLILIFLLALYFWKDFQSRLPTASLALIISGALSNLIDRSAQGFVVDFLDFNLGITHWPAFNLADSCVTVGGILLLVHFSFFHQKHASPSSV